MRRSLPLLLASLVASTVPAAGAVSPEGLRVERDLAVPMRDGTVLRADLWRPVGEGPFPVLVVRTPYGKDDTGDSQTTHLRAVERGYAVVIQDVRGRYGSEGTFTPYFQEGRDGFDTIEWAARQPWSDGRVGTYGLSYPGAVQWLAALERPPHLVAMVPAMTFSSPRQFFTFGGVFDLSWIPWIWFNVAPDARRRADLPGPRSEAEVAATWEARGAELRTRLPLADRSELRGVAPFYFEWLAHPPEDAWWDPLELRGRYDRIEPAVLNLSGWYDEAYGPEGATTNFQGLVAARTGEDPRTALVLGPWVHGVRSVGESRVGDLDFGSAAALDYDDLVLDWMDRWLRGAPAPASPRVRVFVTGEDSWREFETWPPAPAVTRSWYLAPGGLAATPPKEAAPSSVASDPFRPVEDPYGAFGPHDYRSLAERAGVEVFDSPPLADDLVTVGPVLSEVWVSCDCLDTDLWVRLLDVAPDGTAINLNSPGGDVIRASRRDPGNPPRLLEPGQPTRLVLPNVRVGHRFPAGHRIRVQISTSFAPHFSRNLHTGASETESADGRAVTVRIHHDVEHPSRVELAVIPAG